MKRHTVVVTGATKGLGRATALAFAGAGHRVVGFYSTDDSMAETLRQELSAIGAGFQVIKHDITREDAGLWARPEIQQSESLVLINNAWTAFTPKPLHLTRWEDFEAALNVGLRGSLLCSQALLRPMVRTGRGTIVNILTTALQCIPPRGFSAYVSAKHALRGLTLALAAEYAGKGIRCFSVSPGFMVSALTAGWDARLIEAIRGSGPVTDSDAAARRILELVEAPATPGRGEDYVV